VRVGERHHVIDVQQPRLGDLDAGVWVDPLAALDRALAPAARSRNVTGTSDSSISTSALVFWQSPPSSIQWRQFVRR
jgi:hypothetical protein